GQRLAAGDLLDQGCAVATIERQHRDLRLANPRRLELRAVRHDQQNRQARHAFNGKVEQLARSRIDPMRVFESHEDRLLACQTVELADQCLQYPLLLSLRTEVWHWVALRSGQ